LLAARQSSRLLQGEAMRRFIGILRDKKAATAVEYGLILSLIFLAVVVAVQGVANQTTLMWNNVSNAVSRR
jgi:pilus assembly protein Flp/PilA